MDSSAKKKRKREDVEEEKKKMLDAFSSQKLVAEFEPAQKPSGFLDRCCTLKTTITSSQSAQRKRQKQEPHDTLPREQTKCMVCQQDIGLLTLDGREEHVNKCLNATGTTVTSGVTHPFQVLISAQFVGGILLSTTKREGNNTLTGVWIPRKINKENKERKKKPLRSPKPDS
jgi:hypothetical protein